MVVMAASNLPRISVARVIGGSASRLVRCLSTTGTPHMTLYQYAICPYCNIVKTLLHFTDTPYVAKEVNPLTKAEIKFSADYRKVPLLMDRDQQVNGSEAIVEYLLATKNMFVDSTSASALKWTNFARDDLAPLLYPNLCNTFSNSYRAFAYVHNQHFSIVQRYSIQWLGSIAMYMAASKIKKKRNITDERAALMEALDKFHAALEDTHPFLGKDSPHLGDLTIYGVLRGLQGLAVVDTVNQAYPTIQAWYQRMEQLVEPKKSEELEK